MTLRTQAADVSGQHKSGRRMIPIRWRIRLSFSMMVLLVFVGSGASLWFTAVTSRSIQASQESISQDNQVTDLRLKWFAIGSSLDRLVVTHNYGLISQELEPQLDEFDLLLGQLLLEQLGQEAEMAAENRATIESMQATYSELRLVITNILEEAYNGNWEAVSIIRYVTLPFLEKNLDEGIDKISFNLRNELENSLNSVQSDQREHQIYGLVIGFVALAAGSLSAWLATRSITRPLDQLTKAVGEITQGKFDTFTPLPNRDEIGRLSQAFAILTRWLKESHENLENRVTERTNDLLRRNIQIQAASEIARDVTSTLDLETLLNRSVDMIRDRFGFYHAGIFLVDERGEYAVLRAATGDAGRHLLDRGHRLKVGETGLVGYATGQGQARIALDTDSDMLHFKNPLLPNTRSEMALPLKAGNRVIGALNVQSTEASAFTNDDVTILQIMADQLAVAIENARLIAEVQQNMREMEGLYHQYDRESWEQLIRGRTTVGYKCDETGVEPLSGAISVQVDYQGANQPVRVSLGVRGSEIGVLEVWPKSGQTSAQDIELLEAMGSRLSQALESARLFEEARARAAREQMINQMTTKIARSLDIDTLLKAAVQELGQIGRVREVAVHVIPIDGNSHSGNGFHPNGKKSATAEN